MTVPGEGSPAGSDRTRAQSGRSRADDRAESDARTRFDRVVFRAQLNLWWEEAWRRLAPLGALAGVFITLSWLGVWRFASMPVRIVLLTAMAAIAAFLLMRLIRLPAPRRAAARRRVEAASGVAHRPATAFTDDLATPADAAGQVLWEVHRRRLRDSLAGLRAGLPSPRLAERDPYALRFLVILGLVVGFAAAGPERLDRLSEAFKGGETILELAARLDAWVTPPAYSGRPPIFLTGETARPDDPIFVVPQGSTVTVRIGHGSELTVVERGDEGQTEIEPLVQRITNDDGSAPLEHRVDLNADRTVAVRRSGRDVLVWRFAVEPDRPPDIALLQPPRTADSTVGLSYRVTDDYGVVSALADIAPSPTDDGTAPRPLYRQPALPLSLPQLRTRDGTAQTVRDLSAHPWAGAEVSVALVARDEIGQEGRSESTTIRLPARAFGQPLARAVVEQRTYLALDANARHRVGEALDSLTLGTSIQRAGDHLALRSAYRRLLLARDDDDLREVVDYMWVIALGIEEGDLSPLLRDLRAAQEALRQALEEGASDEEIARLTQDLRDAMREFLQALANDALRNPQISNLPPDINSQILRSGDLERMLDRIEDLARSGARDSAQQLLSELQNMLDNLQDGKPMFGDPEQAGQMMEDLNELSEMIRRQEDLLNRTFRADRDRNAPGPDGRRLSREQLEQALGDLQQGQESLADALRQLLERLEATEMIEGGELGDAGQAMDQAAGELGEGQPGAAMGSQGRALDGLRRGTRGLMEQLAETQPGQGGNGPGLNGRFGDTFPNADPLGRPRQVIGPDLGTTVKVPDEIDTQRAREILDAIRRRLGDIGRPLFERDYLERLLDRF